jgi:hypothetical protein
MRRRDADSTAVRRLHEQLGGKKKREERRT